MTNTADATDADTPPSELRVSPDKRTLTVTWADLPSQALAAEMLRVMSPSAEVQGHSPEQRVTVGGKRFVTIQSIEPVGHYAVRIGFGDGHATGLFAWGYLRRLARERDALWATYLGELEAKGLSRDP